MIGGGAGTSHSLHVCPSSFVPKLPAKQKQQVGAEYMAGGKVVIIFLIWFSILKCLLPIHFMQIALRGQNI